MPGLSVFAALSAAGPLRRVRPGLTTVTAVRRAWRVCLATVTAARQACRYRAYSPGNRMSCLTTITAARLARRLCAATVRAVWPTRRLRPAGIADVRQPWRLCLAAAAVAVAVAPGGPAPAASQPACAMPPMPATLPGGSVTRVVDGDTIHVRSASRPRERVRLLGIDAPEMYAGAKLDHDARTSGRSRDEIRALGRESSRFARRYLTGAYVRLELDVQTRDRYGRLLAYVWLADGRMFNLVIVREGYAQVLTIPPNVRYADLLLACQREARDARRGLWGR